MRSTDLSTLTATTMKVFSVITLLRTLAWPHHLVTCAKERPRLVDCTFRPSALRKKSLHRFCLECTFAFQDHKMRSATASQRTHPNSQNWPASPGLCWEHSHEQHPITRTRRPTPWISHAPSHHHDRQSTWMRIPTSITNQIQFYERLRTSGPDLDLHFHHRPLESTVAD